jgi:hypothetical protein
MKPMRGNRLLIAIQPGLIVSLPQLVAAAAEVQAPGPQSAALPIKGRGMIAAPEIAATVRPDFTHFVCFGR